MGLYGSNEGDIEERDDGAFPLHFELPNGGVGEPTFGTFPTILRSMRWGERCYLLAEDEMLEFVSAMHRGWEPRTTAQGFFLLARSDEKLPVSGLPALPQGILDSVHSSPLVVHVRSVECAERGGSSDFPYCRVRIRFQIPIGESIVPGLELAVMEPSSEYRATGFGARIPAPFAPIVAAEQAPDSMPGVFVLKVRTTGRSESDVFLNSESDYRDPRNLSLRISPKPQDELRRKYGDDFEAALKGKPIEVIGWARRTKIVFSANGEDMGKFYYQTHVVMH